MSSSIETRIRIGSNSQWIIAVDILRPAQWFHPSPNMGSKDSRMHHKTACYFTRLRNLGSARKAWGSRLQKARTATNVCFHLLSQATLRALPDKSPSQSPRQLRERVHPKCLRDGMQGSVKHCYAFDRAWLLWSHRNFLTGKCPSTCNVQKSKVTVFRSSNLSSEIHEHRPSSSACWAKKQDAGMLAKRIFCDNVTCFGIWNCVRWCAQPLRCTRHIGRGSLLKWLCSPVWVGRFLVQTGYEPNAKRWKGSRDGVTGHVTSRGRHRACDRQVGGAKEKHGSYRRHAGVWQLWRHAGWSRKEGEAPNSWCGGSSPTASSSGILVGGSMASSLADIPQPGLWAGGSV